jgi:hypothetical protein
VAEETKTPEWYTRQEFADLHKISLSTVKNLVKSGDLAEATIRGAKRISHEELLRFRSKARAA